MERYKSGESSIDTLAGLWEFFCLWLYVFSNNADAVDLPFRSSHLSFTLFSFSLTKAHLHSLNLTLSTVS